MTSKTPLNGLANNLPTVPNNPLEAFIAQQFNRAAQPAVLKPKKPPRKERVKHETRVNVMSDFETTTTANDCRVWAWGLVDIADPVYEKVETGIDLVSFIRRIAQFNSNCYFHNLKFDGRFLLDYLLKNEYVFIEDQRCALEPGMFKALIADSMQFYSITIYWRSGFSTEFRDSYKRLPMAVSKIATSFNLEVGKGEIDYHAEREPGHELTEIELDYLKRDIVIPATALNETMKSGMKKLTIASDALSEYKDLVGRETFMEWFPPLSLQLDYQVRRSYRGGFTYADPRTSQRVVGSGLVLDVNSLYPSVMYNALLPWGQPEWRRGYVETTDDYPFSIFEVTFVAKLKPNHIPCIQIKGSNMWIDTEYLTDINEPTTLMVTSVDWELYNEHYDITPLAYDGGWRFHARRGMFDKYIDKWMTIKASSTGGLREIAKLYLNSLYGKFATNPNIRPRVPTLEGNVVVMKRGKEDLMEPVYTPVGSAITAYARSVTIRAAQAFYPWFAYADTDSLHLLLGDTSKYDAIPKGTPWELESAYNKSSLEIHPTKLGAWKHEYSFQDAFYLRPKFYLERKFKSNDHKDECFADCNIRHDYETHIAGLPLKVGSTLTYDDIWDGNELKGKVRPIAVAGGIVLEDVPFKIKFPS